MPDANSSFQFTTETEDAGLRLDQVLARRVEGLSRRRARVLVDLGGVFVDGKRVKVAGRILRARQRVEAHVGGALDRATKKTGRAARAQDEAHLPAFERLYEDDELVVAFKPAGLLTAPTPESDRNNLASLLGAKVVHRLDLPTSGVLVFAKTDHANRVLGEAFRVHDVERAYLAVVAGAFPQETTRCERTINGRSARTDFQVLEHFKGPLRSTLLRCRLHTGRTHQIRIHARVLGHPVLGDRRYGEPSTFPPPQMALHAELLGFKHPVTGEAMRFEQPLPPPLAGWVARLRA